MPGTIHTDLFTNKLIPDPFFGNNEQSLQWIEKEDWEYKTTFKVSASDLKSDKIELCFEGLDTYAKVFLNDSLILYANNMFRIWNIDAKYYLKKGNNTLRILFENAIQKEKEASSQLTYTLPGGERVFTRKAQYQYGWDWGPRFVTCGIYKNIKLNFIKEAHLKDLHYEINKLSDSLAVFTLKYTVEALKDGVYDVVIKDNATNELIIPVEKLNSQFKKGNNPCKITATIPNPKLWWCNGLGKPNLYNYSVSLVKKSGLLDKQTISVGLRKIELVQDKDSLGQSFYFKLNGVPVFMKGANYIPSHSFLPQLDANSYRTEVFFAREANMNMLRVWGGGVYADDEFYDACDKNGILVWQDFMFACAMYPGDTSFVSNVAKEAEQQVTRLKNHSCIALWCGNNENDEGWKNWGWQKEFNYTKRDSAKIWNDYLNLFHKVLPNSVTKNSNQTPYITTSPKIGWGHKESLAEGDSHYWGVWWGNEPFEVYQQKVGRFMSEYGFQSLPEIRTLKQIADTLNFNLNSAEIKNHQKHPTGFKTIETYMQRDYKVPNNLEDYIYVSQLVQARGMQMAIEAYRRAKPYCMGTLFWQFNDCWPVSSWSALDFNKQQKAFYYDLYRLYDNVLLSVVKTDYYYECHVLNDNLQELKGTLELTVNDFYGKVLYSKSSTVTVKPNSSLVYLRLTDNELVHINKNECYISFKLKIDSKSVKKTLYYFVAPKDLKLPKPDLDVRYADDFGSIKLKPNVLVKNLYIKNLGFSENNYMDIEPGEEIELTVLPFGKTNQKLTFISLYDILSKP